MRKYQLSLILSNFFNDIENRNFQFSKRNIVRENPLAKLVENISGQSQSASSTWFELKTLVQSGVRLLDYREDVPNSNLLPPLY